MSVDVDKVFLLDPIASRAFLEGRKGYMSIGKSLGLWGSGLLVLAVTSILLMLIVDAYRRDSKRTVATEGTIIQRIERLSGKEYEIRYEYAAITSDGPRKLIGEDRYVKKSEHPEVQRAERGSKIPVWYDPDNPSSVQAFSDPSSSNMSYKAIGFMVITAIGWLVGFVFILIPFGGWYLGITGSVVEGKVVKSTSRMQDKKHIVTIHYEFVAPTGIPMHSAVMRQRDDLTASNLPQPGTPLAILFNSKWFHGVL
jgi:hypothetical protein